MIDMEVSPEVFLRPAKSALREELRSDEFMERVVDSAKKYEHEEKVAHGGERVQSFSNPCPWGSTSPTATRNHAGRQRITQRNMVVDNGADSEMILLVITRRLWLIDCPCSSICRRGPSLFDFSALRNVRQAG